jgi:hypothetical protein
MQKLKRVSITSLRVNRKRFYVSLKGSAKNDSRLSLFSIFASGVSPLFKR